tara:strand:+ start:212 stop:571 length:360 start_codon:yes stop_codon:yes gene_type:complete
MSFGKIWKKQIQAPKGNVSIFKPKQGFELEEEDEDCCEEARKKWLDIIEKGWFGSWDFEKEYNVIKFPNEKGTTVSDWNCGLLNDILNDMVYHDKARNIQIPGLANILDEWKECEKNVQ